MVCALRACAGADDSGIRHPAPLGSYSRRDACASHHRPQTRAHDCITQPKQMGGARKEPGSVTPALRPDALHANTPISPPTARAPACACVHPPIPATLASLPHRAQGVRTGHQGVSGRVGQGEQEAQLISQDLHTACILTSRRTHIAPLAAVYMLHGLQMRLGCGSLHMLLH